MPFIVSMGEMQVCSETSAETKRFNRKAMEKLPRITEPVGFADIHATRCTRECGLVMAKQ